MTDLEEYKRDLKAGKYANYEELYYELVLDYSRLFEGLKNANEIAARRLGLLKKIVEESYLDNENQTWWWSCSHIEFDELEAEVGND